MSKVREVYFYASFQEIKTQYVDENGRVVSVKSIDKARDIARKIRKANPGIGSPKYGVFFEEEFDDDTTD